MNRKEYFKSYYKLNRKTILERAKAFQKEKNSHKPTFHRIIKNIVVYI
jgi:hypothetical protein